MRCVDHQSGRKVTVIGQAGHVRTLVASGKASDPDGMALKDDPFPVVVNGWLGLTDGHDLRTGRATLAGSSARPQR